MPKLLARLIDGLRDKFGRHRSEPHAARRWKSLRCCAEPDLADGGRWIQALGDFCWMLRRRDWW